MTLQDDKNRAIGHGGLLRVFSFTRPIGVLGMPEVGFTLTVANDFADFPVNSHAIFQALFSGHEAKISLKNIV